MFGRREPDERNTLAKITASVAAAKGIAQKALGSVDTYRIHKMMAAIVTTARLISGGLFEAGC